MVYFLNLKFEAFKAFLSFKSLAENTTQNKIICIRTDNGGEYLSNEWKNYYIEIGIRHEFTTPYTPQQNGLAERKNRTLMDASRSMLQVADLQHSFWQEACYSLLSAKQITTQGIGSIDTIQLMVWLQAKSITSESVWCYSL
jgi:hypothetical protein